MSARMRLIDTGLRSARWNFAMTAALAELHRTGSTLDTLRFFRFLPSAIVGRHQDLAREVRLDRCRARGIETARRTTGGGAIYMDPGILAWEIVADRRCLGVGLSEATERTCAGIAAGLARLHIPARFRPPGNIEVSGRKLCGTAGYFDGSTLVLQGTVLVDFEISDMAEALAAADSAGLEARLTSVAKEIGRVPPMAEIEDDLIAGLSAVLDFELSRGTPSEREIGLAERLHAEEIGTDGFVMGTADMEAALTS
jgi:lipoate---protein ligase